MAFCSGCGATLPDGATFCAACGRSAAGASASSTGAAAAPAPAVSASGLTDNVAGALAYVTIIPAIIFLVLEPYNKNKFIRFHAFQSIFFCVAYIAIAIALSIVPFIGVLRLMLYPVLWLAFFILWVVMVLKAYQGQMFKAPVIGDFAAKQA
jgi:uncharacterized membrane protein